MGDKGKPASCRLHRNSSRLSIQALKRSMLEATFPMKGLDYINSDIYKY